MTGESISAIGNYGGLGSSGLYGSYYDPSMMMSMMNGYSAYGMNPMMSGMGMMGGLGMNPMLMGGYNSAAMMNQYTDTMKQIYSAQNEIQKMNIENQSSLHEAKEQAKVHNTQVHDEAFFRTVIVNGDFQNSIRELYDAIRDGKGAYANKKFYQLRQEILNKYGDHFNSMLGGINQKDNLDHFICTLYSEYGAGYTQDGSKPDLRYDVKSFGENYFWNGFYNGFMGNTEDDRPTGEEQLHQMFGTEITHKNSKEKARLAGNIAGHVFEGASAAGLGGVIGGTVWGIKKLLTPSWGAKLVPDAVASNGMWKWSGKFGTFVKAGALLATLADIGWQWTRA